MSVFAVWGMTYAHAYGLAQKKTQTIDKDGNIIPEPEWLERVRERAEAILDGELIRQLSPKFDAPQFAEEFIDIVRRMNRHRDLQIRVWRQATDDADKPAYSKKGKKPKMEWSTYEPKPATRQGSAR